MTKFKVAVVTLLMTLFVSSCETVPLGPRSIVLGGETYTETSSDKFISWSCNDFGEDFDAFVEIGAFTSPNLVGAGFILYDRSNSGEYTDYQRKGEQHQWDWDEYSFVIKPSGTGLFYDLSTLPKGETVKARAHDIYKCHRSRP